MFNCEILADSKNQFGDRITTMKITFPRIVLAEFNTHRMFSRNSASSRAIPFNKMVKMVQENPFIPIAWQKDHKGMQGTEYMVEDEIDGCRKFWLEARDTAVRRATDLNEAGATKQLCNRLLEPFMWHTVIVTATEWENFFALRCPKYRSGDKFFRSRVDLVKYVKEDVEKEFGEGGEWLGFCGAYHAKDGSVCHPRLPQKNDDLNWLKINTSQAEIHIQAIAELMWDALNESTPKELKAGEWHIPFTEFDEESMLSDDYLTKIATARCARISYETLGDEPKIDHEADIKLHDMLAQSGHWSPFEHIAQCMTQEEMRLNRIHFQKNGIDHYQEGWSGNLKGFIQYRKTFPNENIK